MRFSFRDKTAVNTSVRSRFLMRFPVRFFAFARNFRDADFRRFPGPGTGVISLYRIGVVICSGGGVCRRCGRSRVEARSSGSGWFYARIKGGISVSQIGSPCSGFRWFLCFRQAWFSGAPAGLHPGFAAVIFRAGGVSRDLPVAEGFRRVRSASAGVF